MLMCRKCLGFYPYHDMIIWTFKETQWGLLMNWARVCRPCTNARAKKRTNTARKNRLERVRKQKERDHLADSYILRLLIEGTPLSPRDIPPELLEAKRQQILLRRTASEVKRNERDHGRGDQTTTLQNRVSRSCQLHSKLSWKDFI